jgi:hypothetical protein
MAIFVTWPASEHCAAPTSSNTLMQSKSLALIVALPRDAGKGRGKGVCELLIAAEQ